MVPEGTAHVDHRGLEEGLRRQACVAGRQQAAGLTRKATGAVSGLLSSVAAGQLASGQGCSAGLGLGCCRLPVEVATEAVHPPLDASLVQEEAVEQHVVEFRHP